MIVEDFYSLLKPNWKVLDLGAGKGKQANQMAKLGAKIIAVDNKEPLEKDPSIVWNIAPIQEWIANIPEQEIFDAILARNIFQFFKKEFVIQTLIPALSQHLRSGGLIAIETFSTDPEPPFERPFWSYWTEDELKNNFPDWKVIRSGMQKENGPDLNGTVRDFYKTDLLAQKP